MENGYYHFHHEKIGKTTHPEGSAKRFAWYMGGFTPKSGICFAVLAIGIPYFTADASIKEKTHLVSAYAAQVEDASRSNARVSDTFHTGLPACMSRREMESTINSFMWAVSKQGRAPIAGFLQDLDSHNPHFHVMFFDRDKDTGKRVQQMSEAGSTKRMRTLWRTVANSKLEEYGYDVRIDERTVAEQAREPLSTAKEIEPPLQQEPSPNPEAGMTPDELLNHIAQRQEDGLEDLATIELTPEDYVRGALELDNNSRWLTDRQTRIKQLTLEAEAAHEAAEVYARQAARLDNKADIHRNAADLARDDLAPLTREDGSYKGFKISFRGWEWESPKRVKARDLAGEIALHKHYQSEARHLADRHLHDAESFAETARARTEHAYAVKRELDTMVETYGESIDETLEIMGAGIQQNLSHCTPDEICALHENGELTAEESTRALTLMGQEYYITRIELRDRQEIEQDELEI